MNNTDDITKEFLADFIQKNLGSSSRKYLTMASVKPEPSKVPNLEPSSQPDS